MNKKELADFDNKHKGKPIEQTRRFVKLLKDLKFGDKDISKLKPMISKLLKSDWEKVSFIICFDPKATPRPRSGRGGIFYVKGARDNMKLFKEFLQEMNNPYGLITTPCKIRIDSYFEIPNGMNRYEKVLAELGLIRPISKPDWDNIGKTYSDMIQTSLLHEDSLIISGTSNKYYSYLPRVEITLEYMLQYDCKFHKRKIESWKSSKDAEIEEKNNII